MSVDARYRDSLKCCLISLDRLDDLIDVFLFCFFSDSVMTRQVSGVSQSMESCDKDLGQKSEWK